MAYDGWIEYNGVELVNLSRTAQLAQTLGITTVWTTPSSVRWIQDELGGVAYNDITEAPWYDPGYPASTEFAGIMPLSFAGLDDSSVTSAPIEYIGDGGHAGITRNATLPIVASVAVIASTDRGAEFGKRWMDRMLRSSTSNMFCAGADLRYFRYEGEGAPRVHRREVSLTRGSSITRKRRGSCSAMWTVTFTLTAHDSYEYGEEVPVVGNLGGVASGPGIRTSGSMAIVQGTCPQYDYTPIYDPLYPAMVPSPTAPNFLPAGWGIEVGQTFQRHWARVDPIEPSALLAVPVITLTSSVEARRVRVSVWPNASATNDQCDPLFSAVVSYLPANQQFVIDGEQKASYLWDGFSPAVRRTDSLVYSPDANPVQWTAFNDPAGLLVTLDVFADSSGYEGDGTIRAALAMVPKSD